MHVRVYDLAQGRGLCVYMCCEQSLSTVFLFASYIDSHPEHWLSCVTDPYTVVLTPARYRTLYIVVNYCYTGVRIKHEILTWVWSGLALKYYTLVYTLCLRKCPPPHFYILNNSLKTESISIIFGVQ